MAARKKKTRKVRRKKGQPYTALPWERIQRALDHLNWSEKRFIAALERTLKRGRNALQLSAQDRAAAKALMKRTGKSLATIEAALKRKAK